ncbi:hypothetical protein ACH436_13475 [Isoptericola sp. NPDC019693]|uniref:hypothetical protein n=1 Tax=Isoptericola sp. NPDC019693 TaxID=3364009 RepID=UPI0037B25C2E
MTDEHETTHERPRANLVRAGTTPLLFGALAWFVGLATSSPALLQVGQSFQAVGLGALTAAAARVLWEQRHDRLHPLAQIGAFVVGAVLAYQLLGDVAGFTGI